MIGRIVSMLGIITLVTGCALMISMWETWCLAPMFGGMIIGSVGLVILSHE
jgi:hypothetical protein